jgi:hypothetical protein
MKKFIFCLITVSVIATLLLSAGPAFAKSEWTLYPIGDSISEFETNWDVEPYNPACYSYDVVDGTLIVTAYLNCVGERFFARINDGGQTKEVKADVIKIRSSGCWRARLLADPLFVPALVGLPHPDGKRDGKAFHQLALMSNECYPSTRVRLAAYPGNPEPWLNLHDGNFGFPWTGPVRPDNPPLVGHKYTLKLSVREHHIDSEINGYGEITFDVPGLQQLPGEDFIGLSCYSSGVDASGEAHYSNVWVRY